MRRQLIIVAGLAAFAILLLASISATLAAPNPVPLLQSGETEPNDDYDTADPVPVPGYVTGMVTDSDTLDYFVVDTDLVQQYRTTLNILNKTGGLNLKVTLYDGSRGFVDEDDSIDGGSPSIQWTAYESTHYIVIEALRTITTTAQTAEYRLNINRIAETPTPTNTPIPTDTPTPTNTPIPTDTPIPSSADSYEDNNSFDQAYALPVATSISRNGLTFHNSSDEDWFKIWAKAGKWYQVTTSGLSGVDTYLEIRDQGDRGVVSDDDGGGGYASQAEWSASYDGYYYVRITNKAGLGSYNLGIEETDEPASEATSTPGPTPSSPGADRCDKIELGNHDFDSACVISVNKSEEFNFAPPPYGGPDNDFFKVWVKSGLLYECATSNLSAGVDPNMIVYDHNRNALGGNDDREPGNYNSYFAYYATYDGWLHLLVGYGNRTPSDVDDSKYTLVCNAAIPGEATTTGTPEATGTPEDGASPTEAPAATRTPSGPAIATATPAEDLTVRALATPTPVPVTTPTPHFIPTDLLIYYDGNGDGQPGAGEGIGGISVQAYDAATNQLLAQGFTDEVGNLTFTVASSGPARVSVPFFGFSQLVAGEGASIYIRVPPQSLPGGAP